MNNNILSCEDINNLFEYLINQCSYLQGALSVLEVESIEGNHIDSKTIEHIHRFTRNIKQDLLQAKININNNNEVNNESLHPETVCE